MSSLVSISKKRHAKLDLASAVSLNKRLRVNPAMTK